MEKKLLPIPRGWWVTQRSFVIKRDRGAKTSRKTSRAKQNRSS